LAPIVAISERAIAVARACGVAGGIGWKPLFCG
jgi:hypothetical protein